MKNNELRDLSPENLKKQLLDTRKAQLNLRFRKSQGTLEKPTEIKKARRLVARIKTIIGQKSEKSKG